MTRAGLDTTAYIPLDGLDLGKVTTDILAESGLLAASCFHTASDDAADADAVIIHSVEATEYAFTIVNEAFASGLTAM